MNTQTMWCWIVLATVLGGCDPGGGDDDGGDDDPGSTASAGSTASGGSASSSGESSGGDRVCGIIDPTLSACDMCAAHSCCDVSEACGADMQCNDCFYAAEKSPECYQNAAWVAFADCVNGPCSGSCGSSGSGGGTGSSNSCGDIACSPDGPHESCSANGCGECSFGKCLLF